MIYDNIANAKEYYDLSPKIKKGFEFLIDSDLKNLSDGKYEILNDDIYANVQSLKTKPIDEAKWEVHRKYIDIQYVIFGCEKMGFGQLSDFSKIITPYNEDKDVEFLQGDKFNFVNVFNGEFTIFTKNDVHAPMLCVSDSLDIKKVIVKIRY